MFGKKKRGRLVKEWLSCTRMLSPSWTGCQPQPSQAFGFNPTAGHWSSSETGGLTGEDLRPDDLPRLFRRGYSSGTSSSPLATASVTSLGALPSMVQPTDMQVPKISLTVPSNLRACDLSLMTLAMLMTSSKVMLPLCLTAMLQADDEPHIKIELLRELTVLLLLPVTRRLLQSLDDQRWCRRHNWNSSLTILDCQLDGDLQTLPFLGSLGNIFTNLLGRLKTDEETNQPPPNNHEKSRGKLTRPNGPILGANEDVAPISPPTARR